MRLNRFDNVDVFAALGAIMETNTQHFQNDFEIDKKILQRAADSPKPGDKALIWFSRPSGTFCAYEREVFTKDTSANHTFLFYDEQTHDNVLAYAVKLTGTDQGKIMGNLYQLDYHDHAAHVRTAAVPELEPEQLAALMRLEQQSHRQLPPASLEAHTKDLQFRAAHPSVFQKLKEVVPAARKPTPKKQKGGIDR